MSCSCNVIIIEVIFLCTFYNQLLLCSQICADCLYFQLLFFNNVVRDVMFFNSASE